MPSFEDPGARTGYALDFFSRTLLLADLLFDTIARKSTPSFMVEALNEMMLFPSAQSPSSAATSASSTSSTSAFPAFSCHLTSIGGGPGYDFVAAALVTSFHAMARQGDFGPADINAQNAHDEDGPSTLESAPMTTVHATVLDYEKGWCDIVEAMTRVTREVLHKEHACTFGICDITKPLADPSNQACLAKAACTDLWVVQYCVAENATLLRESNYVFFTELFEACKEGSLFVLTETTYRQWPELVDRIGDATFDVAFPKSNGRIMVLRKRRGARISDAQLSLCDKFRRVKVLHEKKLERG
jgi:hypothetical protein